MAELTWIEYTTISIAAVGAVLGVINTWNALSTRKLRLKVTPSRAFDTGNGQESFSINVLNLSAFPVTVYEIGLKLKCGNKIVLNMYPHDMLPKMLPARLEPREATSLYTDPARIYRSPRIRVIKSAYTRTACKQTVHGNGSAIKELNKTLSKKIAKKA